MAAPAICRWLIHLASRVAPRQDRVVWRNEYLLSLESLWTLIERGEITPYPAAEMVQFCAGAFRDAFFTRFSVESLRDWRLRPSFILVVCGAFLFAGALLSRGYATTWRVILSAHYFRERDTFVAYTVPVVMAATTALMLLAIGRLSLRRQNWRYWTFLLAKTVLLMILGSLAWVEGGTTLRAHIRNEVLRVLGGGFLLALVYIAVSGGAVVWSLADQRQRCPTCLRRLGMPVTFGSWASVFDPPTTELLCSEGHGSLTIAETDASEADRWITLDSSWK